jgi:hypothetical protein
MSWRSRYGRAPKWLMITSEKAARHEAGLSLLSAAEFSRRSGTP